VRGSQPDRAQGVIEGNALKAFNEECDNYHFADAGAAEGVSTVREPLPGDDSETIGNAVVAWLERVAGGKGAGAEAGGGEGGEGKEGGQQPFMATVWFHTPHQNFAATEKWLRLYNETGKHMTQTERLYYADISGMDQQIGRIRQTLKDLGVYEDTALWFTADNGPEHGTPGSAGGLTGRKRDLTEGGIRNPGLLEWPRRVAANVRTEFPAKIVDYLPTLMDAVGWEGAEAARQAVNPGWLLDGESLLPLLAAVGGRGGGAKGGGGGQRGGWG
jgi:hypothetical protein